MRTSAKDSCRNSDRRVAEMLRALPMEDAIVKRANKRPTLGGRMRIREGCGASTPDNALSILKWRLQ